MLTDLLLFMQRIGLADRFFRLMGVHDGVHEYCPGWCPCEIDFGFDDDYELELEAIA